MESEKQIEPPSPPYAPETGQEPIASRDNPEQRPEIRRRIEKLCRTDADLDKFIADYFPKVGQELARGMNRTVKITELLVRIDSTDVINGLNEYEIKMQFFPSLALDNSSQSQFKANKKWKRRKKFVVGFFAVDGFLNFLIPILSWIADKLEAKRYERMHSPIPMPAIAVAAILCLSIVVALVQRCNHTAPIPPAAYQRPANERQSTLPPPWENFSRASGQQR